MLIKFCQTFVAIQRHLNRRDAQIFAHDKLAKEKDAVGLRLEFWALDVHLGVGSVEDPDPYVFGPPGSGSGSISQKEVHPDPAPDLDHSLF